MRQWTAAVILLWIAGCGLVDPGGGRASTSLDRDTFVEVYVALQRAREAVGTVEAFDSAKAEILDRYGASEAAMLEFVERHGGDVTFLAELWDTLEARLAAPPPED